MNYSLIICALIIYLIGSIPFAFILTKLSGKGDIRNIGSGNIGTTNVLRTGNKFLALLVLLFDISKGYFPTFFIFNYIYSTDSIYAYFLGSCAIFGHLFPIWLNFKGGKGVATYVGFIFAINYFFGLMFIFFWLSIAFLTKYSSLASIVSLISIPLLITFLGYNSSISLYFLLLSTVLIIKHLANIKRLLNKKESKIKL